MTLADICGCSCVELPQVAMSNDMLSTATPDMPIHSNPTNTGYNPCKTSSNTEPCVEIAITAVCMGQTHLGWLTIFVDYTSWGMLTVESAMMLDTGTWMLPLTFMQVYLVSLTHEQLTGALPLTPMCMGLTVC